MLQTIACRRGCGRMLSSLIRPIHSSAATHAKYAGICGSCMTEQEKADMLGAMSRDVLARVAA
jgi:hypothetical protein